MSDLLIRRCTIRVVRRGGWSWGAEPRALLEDLLRRMPELLAAELEPMFSADADLEIAAPLRLRVKLPMAALEAAGSSTGDPRTEAIEAASSTPLRAALRQAVRATLGPVPEVTASAPELPWSVAVPGAASETAEPAAPLALLSRWLRTGQLATRLGRLGDPALRLWHDRVFFRPAGGSGGTEAPIAAIERLAVQARSAALSATPGDYSGTTQLRLRLTLAAALAAASTKQGLSAATLAAIVQFLPEPPNEPGGQGSVPGVPPGTPVVGEPSQPPGTIKFDETGLISPSPQVPGVRRVVAERRVASVLPWLLLGPLARVGWLDTAGSALDVAGAAGLSPLLGVTLARKVLPPPARGWRHSESSTRTAAAAGLLDEPAGDSGLHNLARALEGQLGILDADVAGSLIDGHLAGTPLLLTRVGAGALLLSDLDGLFPIATAPDIGGLLEALRRLLVNIVLVHAEAADPNVLAALERASVRFVTDAPPGRGEDWRLVADGIWSNDAFTPPARLAGIARKYSDGAEMARSAWQAVVLDRPAIPRGGRPAFEEALGLAASLALGSIAWSLWGEAERVSPELALNRFEDLDGLVRVDGASVMLRLPLGRRFFDLRDHAFLDDVPGVPWFGGRVLRFDTG